MTMATLVPRSSMLNFACSIHEMNSAEVNADLSLWSETHLLPQISTEEDAESPARVWMGWNPEGLRTAFHIQKSRAPRVLPKRPTEGDCIELYVDTRDVRTAHRAGRYCHRFIFAPVGGPGRGQLPFFQHLEIQRATVNPPTVQPDLIDIAAETGDDGYVMDIHIPAAALNGYDVEENKRLGLAWIIHDIDKSTRNWPHPDVLPVGMDPSLWATIELVP